MFILFIQVVVSIALIVLIILQERSAGISGIFGGGDGGTLYQTRRGVERVIFISTVVLVIIFAGLAVFKLLSGN